MKFFEGFVRALPGACLAWIIIGCVLAYLVRVLLRVDTIEHPCYNRTNELG
jgi:hypothetical protein